MSVVSPSLASYITGFRDSAEAFLTYLRPGEAAKTFTRGEFWDLARKAASVIRGHGLGAGDAFVNAVGGNQVGDLAFRLAAVMTGTVPVTTNWQADPVERILYKIQLTDCLLVLTDDLAARECVDAISETFPELPQFQLSRLSEQTLLPEAEFHAGLGPNDTRVIIFTSGTTGQPKGVKLPYQAYETNAATFESLLEIQGARLANVIVNPMHHTNSTALTDWSLRRPATHLFLLERYTTSYWQTLVEVVEAGFDRVVAPLVSRHFDFLENLAVNEQLPTERRRLEKALSKVDFLIGSAPVGPTTVKRLVTYSKRIPTVRFGSTETCLQVLGIPRSLSETNKQRTFERGWEHVYKGSKQGGFYIGRAHPPFTEVRVVKSCKRDSVDYLEECQEDEPGLLITRGKNLMTGYVKDEVATQSVFHDEWYSGLGDVCFYLANEEDGERDYYWVSRETALLIRGGSNFAYEQVSDELSTFVERRFSLTQDEFELAVIGLKLRSEHEDDCCVTIEFLSENAKALEEELERHFLTDAREAVSKGSYPNHLRFDTIPKNFKGAILVPELKKTYNEFLTNV